MHVGLLSDKGGRAEVHAGQPCMNDDPDDKVLTCLPHISCLLCEFNEIDTGSTAAEPGSRSAVLLHAEIDPTSRIRRLMMNIKQTYLKEMECKSVTKKLWRLAFGLQNSHLLSDTQRAIKHFLKSHRAGGIIDGKYNYLDQLHDKSNTTAAVLYHLSQVYELMMLAAQAIAYFDHRKTNGPDEFCVWTILSNEPPAWVHEKQNQDKFDKPMRRRLIADYEGKSVEVGRLLHQGWLATDVPFLWLPFIDRSYSSHHTGDHPALQVHLDNSKTGAIDVDECFNVFLLQLDSLFSNWARDVSEMRAKILGLLMTAFLTLMQFAFHRVSATNLSASEQ